jgi:hypothetical protein
MQMINVLKRLAELDAGNPNVEKAKPTVSADAAVEAVQKSLSEELSVESLRYLSGVKQTLDECGMYPEGMGMMSSAPSTPASFSINATAADGDEVANMLAQIMTLAGAGKVGPEHMPIDKEPSVMTTLPSLSQANQAGNDEMKKMIDVMNEPGDEGPVSQDGPPEDEGTLGTMAGAGLGAMLGGPLGAAAGGVAGDALTGDSEQEDEGVGAIPEVDIAGVGGGLAAAAMSDGDPEEIAAGVEAGKEFTGDGEGGEMEAKDHIRKMMDMLDNTPNDPRDVPVQDPDKFAYNPNGGGMGVGDRMDGNMPKGNMTAEDAMTSQLFNEYQKFVTEGKAKCCCDDKGEDKCPVHGKMDEAQERTMSRAAKGVMKYGKDGMQALAKAGKEGKDLDKVRDKYDKYDEGSMQEAEYKGVRPASNAFTQTAPYPSFKKKKPASKEVAKDTKPAEKKAVK